jgi:NADPH:quinone reductase-like Zn-dependent oxidoreductase
VPRWSRLFCGSPTRLADGRLRPLVARTITFEKIADGHAAMAAGGQLGKIVVDR